ncbi:MAG: hypothetical protein ACRCZI_02995 [Cetobacterium sp.]
MTKKHFIALADVIRDDINDFTPNAIERLANFCRSQNANFNKERWINYISGACGPSGGKVKR